MNKSIFPINLIFFNTIELKYLKSISPNHSYLLRLEHGTLSEVQVT